MHSISTTNFHAKFVYYHYYYEHLQIDSHFLSTPSLLIFINFIGYTFTPSYYCLLEMKGSRKIMQNQTDWSSESNPQLPLGMNLALCSCFSFAVENYSSTVAGSEHKIIQDKGKRCFLSSRNIWSGQQTQMYIPIQTK